MNERELALRREIFDAFARTGAPPEVDDMPTLRALAERHVVVLDDEGRIAMAHPFAAERPGATRVEARSGAAPARSAASPGVWFGNCAWDGLGIVAALGLADARGESGGLTVDEAEAFHVAVPARHWWDDIGHT